MSNSSFKDGKLFVSCLSVSDSFKVSNIISYVTHALQNDTKIGFFDYTQTDPSGNPNWINTENWSLTGVESTSPTFEATINMVKPNGSAADEHEVIDLTVSNVPVNENNSTIIEGTTTITMREGPVTDEPTTITLNGNGISAYFDPLK